MLTPATPVFLSPGVDPARHQPPKSALRVPPRVPTSAESRFLSIIRPLAGYEKLLPEFPPAEAALLDQLVDGLILPSRELPRGPDGLVINRWLLITHYQLVLRAYQQRSIKLERRLRNQARYGKNVTKGK